MCKCRFVRRVFFGTLAVVFAFVLVGVSNIPAKADPPAVKVGNIIPLSGPSASVGEQGKNAREMAVLIIRSASETPFSGLDSESA